MDLQNFLTKLKTLKQLTQVIPQVSCDLELAALCRREFSKPDGGKVLFFEQLEGSQLPVVANLFGSHLRIAQMLHSHSFDDFTAKVQSLFQGRSGSAGQRLSNYTDLNKVVEFSSNDLQTVAQFDLHKLPAIRTWPGEEERYLTLALTLTQHPITGRQNLGLYRAQILGPDQIALNFAPGSGADKHLQIAVQRNQPLPVALFLGSDPALVWTAAAPLPGNCAEFSFYCDLFDTSLKLTSCLSQDLQVPANAEIVIEGQIQPGQTCVEGPFGNHTGQYVTRNDCPLVQVTAIRQKAQPVIPITVVGPPPSENIFLAQANLVLIREMLKIDYPQILDLQMPVETVFHNVSLLTIRSQSRCDNRELIDKLWNGSPLRRAKMLILLDEDINLNSFSQCWWRTLNILKSDRIYQDSGRIAVDATGVDPASLVVENQKVINLINRRKSEYKL